MKRFTDKMLRDYIANHSKWGPAKREERARFFALALCGEAGELANLFKKEWRGDLKSNGRTHPAILKQWRSKVKSEAADVGAYTMMLMHLMGFGDLGPAVWEKFMEVEERPIYQAAEALRRGAKRYGKPVHAKAKARKR